MYRIWRIRTEDGRRMCRCTEYGGKMRSEDGGGCDDVKNMMER
jgi:hypothetical protein